jgi:metal-dependent amidase/aminoacylase/carboxypeptidase family protein
MTVDVKLDGLLDEAGALQPRTIALRRSLHRHPEVGLQLPRTQQAALRARVVQLAEGIAAAHGATATVDVEAGYPVTVNDAGAAELLGGVAAELVGSDRVRPLRDPVMGSEDFSYVLQRVPGAIAFLGGCPPGVDPEEAPSNHSRQVVFDEDALAVGVATYAGAALRQLAPGGSLGACQPGSRSPSTRPSAARRPSAGWWPVSIGVWRPTRSCARSIRRRT